MMTRISPLSLSLCVIRLQKDHLTHHGNGSDQGTAGGALGNR